jgi:hypothetical protein
MAANTTGYVNTVIGHGALPANTTGAGNVVVGTSSLPNQTTGNFNTCIGYASCAGITTGSNNTIIGGAIGSLAAALSDMVIVADGNGDVVFQARGGTPNPSAGTIQAGSSNSYGTVTGIGANTSISLTFSTAYATRSRCFIQAVSGAQVFTVTQSASAPVIACFDMAGAAANCVDLSYHCVGQ